VTPLADHETRLRERFPEAVVEATSAPDMGVIAVRPDAIVDVLTDLRDAGFDMLTDLSAVDWFRAESGDPAGPRFDINYTLYSMATYERLRVKVRLGDDSPHIASATSVWPGANWHEREVYDFFGIVFDGHPDLRRILMPDEWIGHPLRKDYPVGGVPVEYRIEPAYIGQNVVPPTTRPAAGGVPARLRRDRGRASHWTWTGPPASGVPPREGEGEPSQEGEES
jgi:NADH-quinone oxidoreductase subunit C